MKILLASDGKSHNTESAVEFCPTSKNTYTGMVKLRLPLQSADPDNPTLVNAKISVTADSTTNAKGRTRILFKAALPYAAVQQVLNPTGAQTGFNAFDVDTKRSGGEVAVHTVISVPKALREDILGRNGADEQSAAACQLALLGQLVTAFTKLIQPFGVSSDSEDVRNPVVYDIEKDEFTVGTPSVGKIPTQAFGCLSDGTLVAGQQTAMFFGAKAAENVTIVDNILTGQLSKAPIMRALNGLSPICAEEQYRTANLRAETV